MTAVVGIRVLPESEWRARAVAHEERVDALVGPYLRRRAAGAAHPVIDFLFTYYGHKPTQLRRWHPGYGIALAGAAEYDEMRGYHRVAITETATEPTVEAACPAGPSTVGAPSPGETVVTADPAFLRKRHDTIGFIARLLRTTAARPAQLSCFGLHEWAMVYRTDEIRHRAVPLRLGTAGTDAVVESMSLRCTHFDAYRFFTPDAVGRNAHPLGRETQVTTEQPGCLHANMDLYKWAFKTSPLIHSDLLLDCFELACDARELDMRASPYDLAEYGHEPIRIETPAGRAEYVRRQVGITDRAVVLRSRLLDACETLLART
ncbi:hypothetical protein [Nocardia brevicatena]|uniref:hypothetical protein n=1 Tax=Nocardia brevicatena TaxID=37327 RepID=UPI0002F18A6E|nr:hypothetical protein [Nocardia brevicatena]